MQLQFDFAPETSEVSPTIAGCPRGYTGLYGFHKYWGKKPHEPLAFIIERLTYPGQVVFDPFVGSGTAAREALLRGRRFIGFDINPVAVALTRMLVAPPNPDSVRAVISQLEEAAKCEIVNSYRLADGKVASHYLWEGPSLLQAWSRGVIGRTREERKPTEHDYALSRSFQGYRSRRVRPPQFFTNTRINANPGMSLNDIMTGRAQRNLDLLIEAIENAPSEVQPAMKLCLTAASGQMTKMVFAVTGRGKTAGKKSSKIEVGSWVIGYWRPKLHFEVNAWNCFERRTSKLLRALKSGDPLSSTQFGGTVDQVFQHNAEAYVSCTDCRREMNFLPDHSIDLIITDPPHSDRVPYLELSEFWNSILGFSANFDQEIVFSNAREREKTAEKYVEDMKDFFLRVPRLLTPSGFLVLIFNARKRAQWAGLRSMINGSGDHGAVSLNYLGSFPCTYSAGSVVQDTRKGSLKSDYALVFSPRREPLWANSASSGLAAIPGWSQELPDNLCGD